MNDPKKEVSFNDFLALDIRVGTIVSVDSFTEARNPAYILKVDFGEEIGLLKSSAQITDNYTIADLIDKQVVAVVNFPNKQIGPIQSQCLITGFHQADGSVHLCVPDALIPNGTRML